MLRYSVRTRFFVAVEGESERSFLTWLQSLPDLRLRIHLDSCVLGGGGYKSMLNNAIREHERRRRALGSFKNRCLIVDSDRATQGDWPIDQLKREAAKAKFIACVQNPNHEGLLLRMLPGMERESSDAASAEAKLRSRWPVYKKPASANELGRQFCRDDLLRAASLDKDLRTFLELIGFIATSR